ncbi:hypothetical protein GH839_28615, partial [Bacillus thuringiensis]|nr:hypothetical protein [Bacillus thuringiensis]
MKLVPFLFESQKLIFESPLLEKQFRNLEHVDTITSSTYEGLSRIDITYTSKANMKDAAREVEKAVNTIKLPKDGSIA